MLHKPLTTSLSTKHHVYLCQTGFGDFKKRGTNKAVVQNALSRVCRSVHDRSRTPLKRGIHAQVQASLNQRLGVPTFRLSIHTQRPECVSKHKTHTKYQIVHVVTTASNSIILLSFLLAQHSGSEPPARAARLGRALSGVGVILNRATAVHLHTALVRGRRRATPDKGRSA